MRFGIIAEGVDDQTVITYILQGLGIDSSQVITVRPDLKTDRTDKAYKTNLKSIGTWQGVKNACLSKEDFENFFLFEDSSFMIVHLDTAEIDSNVLTFGRPTKPKKDFDKYVAQLRLQTVNLINDWLSDEYTDRCLHAIAIEEIEAWILTLCDKNNSVASANPKKKLQYQLKEMRKSEADILLGFREIAILSDCCSRNKSLHDFVEQVLQAIEQVKRTSKAM